MMMSESIDPGTIRWVRPEGIHLTLKFLGDVNAADMQDVHRVMLETVPRFSPFSFSVEGIGCFPDIRRVRVIWVAVREESGVMAALYAELERAFAARGFERENRRFHPHLTLGRLRRGVSQAERRLVGEMLGNAGNVSLGEVNVNEICLFRSELKPSGAVYTRLLVVPLEGRA